MHLLIRIQYLFFFFFNCSLLKSHKDSMFCDGKNLCGKKHLSLKYFGMKVAALLKRHASTHIYKPSKSL